jgi:hypothetical protein
MNSINAARLKAGYIVVLFLLLAACEKESGTEQITVNLLDSALHINKFQQVTFVVNLFDSVNGFANLEKIDSVKINVNGNYWGTFSSQGRDTSGRTKHVSENINYSKSKINYLIIAPFQSKVDQLETVGDFVQYLNNSSVLAPGDYVSEISEVKFKNKIGKWITINPQIFKEFTVVENTTSSYVGEIEIPTR